MMLPDTVLSLLMVDINNFTVKDCQLERGSDSAFYLLCNFSTNV